MHVVRFHPEFKGTLVGRNRIARGIRKIIEIAQQHPSLLEIRQEFYRSFVRNHRDLLAVKLHHGIAQVEPGKRLVTALVNRRTVKRHGLLEFSLVIKFVRLEEVIIGCKKGHRKQKDTKQST